MTDVDLLIVGGGIAGWSAAHAAAGRGRRVTIVDEGVHRASDVPVALINPLRGHAGRLVPRGVEGMDATFALIDRLRIDGQAIAAGRGLWRPLVDLHGDLLTEAYWRARIAGRIDFDYFDASPPGLGLIHRPPALYLPRAGWVASSDLLAALRAGSGVVPIAARVESVARDGARLSDGTSLRAKTVIWCGGAWGNHRIDEARSIDDGSGPDARGDAVIYKPGSLAVTDAPITDAPMTFGLYAAPWGDGGMRTLIGPTREDATATLPTALNDDAAVDDAIARLQDRARSLFGGNITLAAAWRGVRLARLSAGARETLRDVTTLTALGSRGFLMAPLLAQEWAASL